MNQPFNEQYTAFASMYDTLMYDQPYDEWLALCRPYLPAEGSVLDLACGTGSFTVKLPSKLLRVGMDLSTEMLAVAQTKDATVNWIEQDMTIFDLDMQFDLITCFCDSLNYITEPEDLMALFQRVKQHLKPNGTLLFDVHSMWKMVHLFNGQTYSDDTETVTYLWHAVPGEETGSVYHDMTFFIKEADGRYVRFDESHYQKTYSSEIYEQLLLQCGLSVKQRFADFDVRQTDVAQAERIFFVVKHSDEI